MKRYWWWCAHPKNSRRPSNRPSWNRIKWDL